MHQPNFIPSAPKWKHISQIRTEGINYMIARQQGLVKSLKTPWQKFNDSGINGIEWGNVVVVGARPGVGKTAIVNNITRMAPIYNPDQDFAVLDFQFEMSGRTTAVREFSSVTKKSFTDLLSATVPLDERDLDVAKNYTTVRASDQIYQVEDPMTVPEMKQAIIDFVTMIQKPVVVTIDHSVLVKANNGDKFNMLADLGEMCTDLKKKLPVIFIILTQMNRSIEELSRKTAGTLGNYPTTADVYGSDALLQHCDIMVALNKPAMYHLPYYGPEQFVVTPRMLAMHFIKVRNGEHSICFFETYFEEMRIQEYTPNRKGGPVNTSPPSGMISLSNITP